MTLETFGRKIMRKTKLKNKVIKIVPIYQILTLNAVIVTRYVKKMTKECKQKYKKYIVNELVTILISGI